MSKLRWPSPLERKARRNLVHQGVNLTDAKRPAKQAKPAGERTKISGMRTTLADLIDRRSFGRLPDIE